MNTEQKACHNIHRVYCSLHVGCSRDKYRDNIQYIKVESNQATATNGHYMLRLKGLANAIDKPVYIHRDSAKVIKQHISLPPLVEVAGSVLHSGDMALQLPPPPAEYPNCDAVIPTRRTISADASVCFDAVYLADIMEWFASIGKSLKVPARPRIVHLEKNGPCMWVCEFGEVVAEAVLMPLYEEEQGK